MVSVTGARALVCGDGAVSSGALLTIVDRGGFRVLASVDSPERLLWMAATSQPEVIVLHLGVVGFTGLHVVRILKAVAPGCAVVLLSPFVSLRTPAIESGAYDLVDSEDLRELQRCLERLRREPTPNGDLTLGSAPTP